MRERGVFAAAVLVVATPLVAAIVAWRGGWMPYGDEAATVAQSWGTSTTSPPLLGIYSTVTTAADASQTLYHPGPMQAWLLAVPLRLFAPSNAGVLIGSALIVSASLGVLLAATRRSAGLRGLLPMTVLVAALVHGIGAQFLRSPYLDAAAMFTLLGLIGAGWAVMNRDDWFWPVAVACASVSAQAQVAFALPAATVAVAIVVVRGATWLRDRRRGGGEEGSRRRAVTIAIVSVLIGVGCWSGPLYDQFFGSGNLSALIGAGAGAESVGVGWAWNRLVDTLAFPPAWTIGGLRGDGSVLADGTARWRTPTFQVLQAGLFLAVFVWAIGRCVRRRNRALATFGVLALAAVAGAFAAAAAMPDDLYSLIGHTRAWRIAGFIAWAFPALVVTDLVVDVVRRRTSRPAVWLVRAGALACLTTAVLAVVTLGGASPADDESSNGYGPVARFAEVGSTICESAPEGIVVTQDGFANMSVTLGVIAQLQLSGCAVHVGDELAKPLPGAWFRATGAEPVTLRVALSADPPPGYRKVATYDPGNPPDRYRGFDGVNLLLQHTHPVHLFVREHPA